MEKYNIKFEKNAFTAKKKLVEEGKSRIFKNWLEHSTITKSDFINALAWVCDDNLDEKKRPTREIALTPTCIIKLHRGYTEHGLCAFYKVDDGTKWEGDWFEREPLTEKEKKFAINGKLTERHMISLSCKDMI